MMKRIIRTTVWAMLILLTPAATPQGVADQAPSGGYWRTSGKLIVDSDGNPVKITGVTWFGMETSSFAPHGLWIRGYREMLEQMKSLGFNTVRLPFSNQLFDAESRPTGIDFTRNPDLQDLTGLQIMDRIVAHASRIGLKVILDRHRPDANGQSELWYTSACPESRWITDWKMLVERYKGEPAVIGVDLHNEPRNPACWGCGESSLDWRLAAQRAGNAILEVNPNLLIIVEGVELYRNDAYWWGGNLKGVAVAPILLDIAHRVVYSAHDYPSSIAPQVWFRSPEYPANLERVWDDYWGYIARTDIAPVLMGEFGSRLDSESDRKWFDAITAYLGKGGFNWLFWSWNPNSQDTGGLLLDDWVTVDERKLSKLKPIQGNLSSEDGSPPAAVSTPAPQPQPSAPVTNPSAFCTTASRTFSNWGTGYNADLELTNVGAGPVNGWTITWQFSGDERVRELWNGRFTQQGRKVSVTDAGWNAGLPQNSAAYLGFIVEYSGEPGAISDITLNGFPCISKQ
jgi:endoglucanase